MPTTYGADAQITGTLEVDGDVALGTGDDDINLDSNTLFVDADNDRVGIGTTSPDYELDVAGNVGLDEYIYHNGDADTFIRFQTDEINIKVGDINFVSITEDTQNKIVFNDGAADVDFIVRSPNESKALYLNAANEVLHINHGDSSFQTKIHSTNGNALEVNNSGVTINEGGYVANDFRVESNNNTHMLFIDAGNDTVGIGTSTPYTAFSVAHDYNGTTFENQLSDGEGGGEVLKYSPGADDDLTAGQLYYLHVDGTWNQTDADSVATGGIQLLGVGLGNARTDGVLLKGFIKVPSTEILNLPAMGMVDGMPVYASTTAGHFDFAKPTGTGDFVRVVGYAIDDDSSDVLVYFNPSQTSEVVS